MTLPVVVVAGNEEEPVCQITEGFAERGVRFLDLIVSGIASHNEAVEFGESVSDFIQYGDQTRPGRNASQFTPVGIEVAVRDLENAIRHFGTVR